MTAKVCKLTGEQLDEERSLRSELKPLLDLRPEIIEVLQLLVSYGMIYTVKGVVYPDGTHKEAIDKGNEILWKLRQAQI